ncbi:MAG: branched-chain amino acid aminotransferase [Bacteriovoracaceae bacterium]|jgi:branched-chain amino acid aminotransferase
MFTKKLGTFFLRVIQELPIKEVVSINGQIDSKAAISVFDRGFLYGDSVYEVTLTYNKIPFLLDEHLDRLYRSARSIHMEFSFTREELIKDIYRVIEKLEGDRQYIRIIVTRGAGEINLDPSAATKNNLVIIARNLPEYPTYWYEKGVSMIITDVLRNSKRSMDPGVKSGNYLNNVLAMAEAKEKKAFDAIMLNYKGNITEGTTSNIWIVEDKKFITPPLDAGLLGGITRKTLLLIASKNNLIVSEENISPERLKAADECFLTSSTKEIVPIISVDDSPIGSGVPGPQTKILHKIYKNFVEESLKK